STCGITTPPGRTVPSASSRQPKLPPSHRRSTSPGTGSAETKSSADSPTSTRPPHDSLALLREEPRHRDDRTFEPNRMSHRRLAGTGLGIATAHTVRVLDGEGATVAKRKAWPAVGSLTAVEAAALAG